MLIGCDSARHIPSTGIPHKSRLKGREPWWVGPYDVMCNKVMNVPRHYSSDVCCDMKKRTACMYRLKYINSTYMQRFLKYIFKYASTTLFHHCHSPHSPPDIQQCSVPETQPKSEGSTNLTAWELQYGGKKDS